MGGNGEKSGGISNMSRSRWLLPKYKVAVTGFQCDHSDVSAFTSVVLAWWAKELPKWSSAARICFSFSPNSCACERVFSLLKEMFGEDQDNCLGDYLQAALMIRYNKRL